MHVKNEKILFNQKCTFLFKTSTPCQSMIQPIPTSKRYRSITLPIFNNSKVLTQLSRPRQKSKWNMKFKFHKSLSTPPCWSTKTSLQGLKMILAIHYSKIYPWTQCTHLPIPNPSHLIKWSKQSPNCPTPFGKVDSTLTESKNICYGGRRRTLPTRPHRIMWNTMSGCMPK